MPLRSSPVCGRLRLGEFRQLHNRPACCHLAHLLRRESVAIGPDSREQVWSTSARSPRPARGRTVRYVDLTICLHPEAIR